MARARGRAPFPDHFDGKRFYNPGADQARGLLDALRWKLTSRPEPCPRFVDDVEPCAPPSRVESGELRITLVNHSTVLLQQGSANILTDPMWSERASPLSWIGPRRRRQPGVRREQLPHIDMVLISHNHYDHLDLTTIRWLDHRDRPVFVAPLGLARLLSGANIAGAHELDWGDSRTFSETTIHAVPALHFSSRSVFDRNRTLWCGYVIEWQNRCIYFAGDTAFGVHFAQIRRRFGSPQLALLPIGAYAPRWFMRAIHMDPEDALRAHEILGSPMAIAIHHGTFQLGDDAIDTPKRELRRCGAPDSFRVLQNGESAVIV